MTFCLSISWSHLQESGASRHRIWRGLSAAGLLRAALCFHEKINQKKRRANTQVIRQTRKWRERWSRQKPRQRLSWHLGWSPNWTNLQTELMRGWGKGGVADDWLRKQGTRTSSADKLTNTYSWHTGGQSGKHKQSKRQRGHKETQFFIFAVED